MFEKLFGRGLKTRKTEEVLRIEKRVL